MSQSALPPIPQVSHDHLDVLLDVYTHSSLRFGNQAMNDGYGDTDRLTEMGGRALDLIVTHQLISRKPPLTVEEIKTERDTYLSPENIGTWIDGYNLRSKFRYNPAAIPDEQLPLAFRNFFYSLVGALYLYSQNGLGDVRNWIWRLLDPFADVMAVDPTPSASTIQQTSPWSQLPQGQTQPQPPTSSPPPMPPTNPPPPAPPGGVDTSLITLSLVNQTAAQKNMKLDYRTRQEGPPHQPTWYAIALLNDEEKGTGQGKTSKAAKEQAAISLWFNTNWGSR